MNWTARDYDREALKGRVRTALAWHEGPEHAITMVELWVEVTGEIIIPGRKYDQTRLLRSIVRQLRREGVPIARHHGKGGGYFLATTPEQSEAHAARLRGATLAALAAEADWKRITRRQLAEQYALDLANDTDEGDPEDAPEEVHADQD